MLAAFYFLNSREEAAIIWAAVLFGYLLHKDASIGRSLLTLMRDLFAPALSRIWVMAAGYTAGVVVAAHELGLWHPTATKETVYWFIGTGAVLTMNAMTTRDSGGDYAKQVVRKAIRFTIVTEFLVNLYVMPFVAELFVVPLITVFVLVQAYAERDAKLAPAKTFADATLTLIGSGIMIWVIVAAATDLHGLLSREHAEGLLVVPAMTLAFVPFLYAMWRWSKWQSDRLLRRWRSEFVSLPRPE